MDSLPPDGGDRRHGSIILGVSWGGVLIATIVVILRVYTRERVKQIRLGWDDWTMIAALVFSWLETLMLTAGVANGLGRHVFYLTDQQTLNVGKYYFLQAFLGCFSFFFVKSSIAFLLLRFMKDSKNYAYILYLCLLANFCNFVVSLFFIAQCVPVQAQWDSALRPHAKCISKESQLSYFYATTVIQATLDFTFAILPGAFVSFLKLGFRDILGLAILMSIGALAGVCSIVKSTFAYSYHDLMDFTWTLITITVLFSVELNISIIAGSAPPIRPFLSFIFARASFSQSSRRSEHYASAIRAYNGSPSHDLGNLNYCSTKVYTVDIEPASQENILPSLSSGSQQIAVSQEFDVSSTYDRRSTFLS